MKNLSHEALTLLGVSAKCFTRKNRVEQGRVWKKGHCMLTLGRGVSQLTLIFILTLFVSRNTKGPQVRSMVDKNHIVVSTVVNALLCTGEKGTDAR